MSAARPHEGPRAAVRPGAGVPPPAPRAPARQRSLPLPALARLLRDAQADLADYGQLADLLEQQFDSAMQHDGARLTALAPQITALVDTLDERRRARVALAAQLLGPQAPVELAALLERVPAGHRASVQAMWDRLGAAVQQCKARNARNARLMTEQNALLQRVLHGPQEGLYEGL